MLKTAHVSNWIIEGSKSAMQVNWIHKTKRRFNWDCRLLINLSEDNKVMQTNFLVVRPFTGWRKSIAGTIHMERTRQLKSLLFSRLIAEEASIIYTQHNRRWEKENALIKINSERKLLFYLILWMKKFSSKWRGEVSQTVVWCASVAIHVNHQMTHCRQLKSDNR